VIFETLKGPKGYVCLDRMSFFPLLYRKETRLNDFACILCFQGMYPRVDLLIMANNNLYLSLKSGTFDNSDKSRSFMC